MRLAARVGDMTSHGTPLTRRSARREPERAHRRETGLASGRRAPLSPLDRHRAARGRRGHQGQHDVLINKRPRRAWATRSSKRGPPNAIAAGCPTVLIGG